MGLQSSMKHYGFGEERLCYVGTSFSFLPHPWQSALHLCCLHLHGSGTSLWPGFEAGD